MFLDSRECNASVISSCVIYKSLYCYMLCFVQVMQYYRRYTQYSIITVVRALFHFIRRQKLYISQIGLF
jgi:hypothetical protein